MPQHAEPINPPDGAVNRKVVEHKAHLEYQGKQYPIQKTTYKGLHFLHGRKGSKKVANPVTLGLQI